MSNTTTNKTTETPAQSNNAAAQTGSIGVNLLKLAGAAFLTYRAISAAKKQALPASTNSGVNRNSDQPSMASVDKNVLLNTALQHMRNMTRITTRW
jgi:hypothetical protein